MKDLTSIQDVYVDDMLEFEKIAASQRWTSAEFFQLLIREHKRREQNNIAEIVETDQKLESGTVT